MAAKATKKRTRKLPNVTVENKREVEIREYDEFWIAVYVDGLLMCYCSEVMEWLKELLTQVADDCTVRFEFMPSKFAAAPPREYQKIVDYECRGRTAELEEDLRRLSAERQAIEAELAKLRGGA